MNINDLGKNYTVIGSLPPRQGQTQTQNPTDNRDLLQKTGDAVNKVFPGKQVGESIGTAAGFGFEKLKGALGLKDNSASYDLSAPNPVRVAGDIAAGALTVAGFKGAGIGKTALGTIGKGSALGAGFGAAESVREGESLGKIAKNTAAGAALGGVLSVAGVGAEKALQSISNLPSRFVQSAIGQTKKELLAGKDLTKFITANKKIGSAQGLIKQSQEAIESLDTEISNILQASTKKFTKESVLKSLEKSDLVQNSLLKADEVLETVSKVAPQARKLLAQKSLSVTDMNKLRQQIDKSLGSRVFDAPEVAFQKDIAKEFTNKLRALVQKSAPETKDLFKTYSQEIRLRDALANKVQGRNKNQIISFGDLIGGGIGGAALGPAGAIGGAALRRGIQSTPFLTASAVITDQMATTLLPVLQKLAPAVQTEIISALEKALIPPASEDTD